MKVKELISILTTCDPDIQVVISQKGRNDSFSVCYGIKSVAQVKNNSLHDEPKWPDTVEINIGK